MLYARRRWRCLARHVAAIGAAARRHREGPPAAQHATARRGRDARSEAERRGPDPDPTPRHFIADKSRTIYAAPLSPTLAVISSVATRRLWHRRRNHFSTESRASKRYAHGSRRI